MSLAFEKNLSKKIFFHTLFLSKSAPHKQKKNCTRALKKMAKSQLKSQTSSSRAGVKFPVGRIRSTLRRHQIATRVSANSAVFIAATLDTLARQLFTAAGLVADDKKRTRITPSHLKIAIDSNEDLMRAFGSLHLTTTSSIDKTKNIIADQKNLIAERKKKRVKKADGEAAPAPQKREGAARKKAPPVDT